MSSKREKRKARQRHGEERRERRREARLAEGGTVGAEAAGREDPGSPSHSSSPSPLLPRVFVTITPGAGQLEEFGPLILSQWSVPLDREQQLRAEGKPVPPPVSGYMLFDTGANGIGISLSTAQELGLKPIDTVEATGAHGKQPNELYCARWILRLTAEGPDDDTLQQEITFARDVKCIALKNFQEAHAERSKDRVGGPLRVIGVIGRDFMRHTRFHYDGPQGTLNIEVDLTNMQRQRLPETATETPETGPTSDGTPVAVT